MNPYVLWNAQDREYKRTCARLHFFRKGYYWWRDAMHHRSLATRYLSAADLMDGAITTFYPGLKKSLAECLPDAVFPLLDVVVGNLATSLKGQLVVELVDRTTHKAAVGLPVVDRLPAELVSTGVIGTLRRAEEYLETFNAAVIQYRIVRRRLVARALPPFAVDVDPDPAEPENAAVAQRVVIADGGLADPWSHPSNALVYERQEADDDGVYAIGVVGPDGRPVVDAMGMPARVAEALDGWHSLGRHPVAVWTQGDLDGRVFPEPPHTLLNAAINVNLMMVRAKAHFDLGSHGVYSLEQTGPKADAYGLGRADDQGNVELSVGIAQVLSLPHGAKLAYTQPAVNVTELVKGVEAFIKLYLVSRHLPHTLVDLSSPAAYQSGLSRLVAGGPLEEARARREADMRDRVVAALDTLQPVWNVLHPLGDPLHIPAELGFRVDFRNPPAEATDQSAAQATEIAARNGLLDPVDELVARHPGWTRDEAQAEFARRRQ